MDNNQRIHYIDTWRFLAIALVVFAHLIEFSHPVYRDLWPGLIWRVHPLGRLGVQVFFCISGYVICRGMLRETRDYGSLDLRGFYIRRAFRILPPLVLYGVCLALMTGAGLVHIPAAQFAQSAAFLCNIQAFGECGWYLGHTWSLAYEEQFYLAFPLLFVAFALPLHRGRLLAGTLALTIAAAAAQLASHPALGDYLSTFTYMLWGCLCALHRDALEQRLRRLPVPVWLALGAALVGLNFFALPLLFVNVVYPAVAPLAICVLVFGTPLRHPLVRRLFGATRLAYLGRISYMIYLLQQAATTDYGFESPLAALALVALVCWLAHLSFRYVERPLIRIGAALAARPAAQPAATTHFMTDDAEMQHLRMR